MPLFDFFKKKPKEPSVPNNAANTASPKKEILEANSFGSSELIQKAGDVAKELLPIFKDSFFLPNGQPDVIMDLTAAAWITGTYLYRVFNSQENLLTPGSKANFSPEKATEIFNNWLVLMNYMMGYFSQKQDNISVLFLVASSQKICDEHRPQMGILEVQEKFQNQFDKVLKKHGLNNLHGPIVGMVVCTLLIREYCVLASKLDMKVAIGIVGYKSMEAAKTVPAPLQQGVLESAEREEQNAQSQDVKKPPEIGDRFTPERQEARLKAALEFFGLLQKQIIAKDGSAHAGTVLSAAAWLAGTSLYRSFNYQDEVAPGTIVLSPIADQEYPKLLDAFATFCKRLGLDVMAQPLATKFPEKDKPQLKIEQVREEFQDTYHEIMLKHGLDYLDEALAGMIACSIILQHHVTIARDIDLHIATGLVAMGVVEGSKTAPPPLKLQS